jgi:hypothetical protein
MMKPSFRDVIDEFLNGLQEQTHGAPVGPVGLPGSLVDDPMTQMKDEFQRLAHDMAETAYAARGNSYPESHSDLESCMYHLIKMFEIRRRPIALEWKDMRKEKGELDE